MSFLAAAQSADRLSSALAVLEQRARTLRAAQAQSLATASLSDRLATEILNARGGRALDAIVLKLGLNRR